MNMMQQMKNMARALLYVVLALLGISILANGYLFVENAYFLNKIRNLKNEIRINTPPEELYKKMVQYEHEIVTYPNETKQNIPANYEVFESLINKPDTKMQIRFEAGPKGSFIRPSYYFVVNLETPGKIISIGKITKQIRDISNGPAREETVDP